MNVQSEVTHHGDHIVIAGAIVTSLSVMWRLALVPIHRTMRKVVDFVDDWNGEDEQPGKEPRPGVLARLTVLEKRVTDMEHRKRT